MFVKIINGVIEKFPYSMADLRKDNNRVSFPRSIPAETLAEYGAYEVLVQDIPAYDDLTQRVVTASVPVEINGIWTITRTVEQLSAAEAQAKGEEHFAKIANEITAAIQKHLYDTAKPYDFDNIRSARAQAGANVPAHENQRKLSAMTDIVNKANALASWELECWATAKIIKEDVLNGVRSMPTAEEAILELPVLVMP